MSICQLIFPAFLLVLISCANPAEEVISVPEYIPSNCENLPGISYNTDSILSGMELKLKDSLWATYWMPDHNAIVEELTAFKNGRGRLFPYSDFDSTVFHFYEWIGTVPELDGRRIENYSILCPEKAALLLRVINDPLNYSTGECGTDVPFAQVVFYSGQTEVGHLTFGCNYSSVGAFPENDMIFGNFNTRGDSLLNLVAPWD